MKEYKMTLEGGEEVTVTILNTEDPIDIIVAEGPECDICGGLEVLLGGTVRPFKVFDSGKWWSHCTKCNHWF